ncbi:MAG: peptide ABC transporter substrate-binding protein [Armatimonadetes bacterium]|nr:peptide ABC transporter substrate-binding protein [Armatimonadota bacterium]
MKSLVIAVGLAALLISGCSKRDASLPAGNVLRYPLTTEPTTFDPALVEDGPTIDMLFQVFEGLVRWEVGSELMPNIAESWEISEDGRTYTFKLKQGVKFHNGRELKAEDFVYSVDRCLDPDTLSPTAGTYLNDLVGAKERMNGQADTTRGIRAIDDYTLEIEIDAPKAYFLAKLTYPTWYALCKEEVEKGGGKITAENMVGTGPFKLKEYRKNSKVILAANEDYHDGRPTLDGIERPIVLDATIRHQMFERGEVDLVDVQKGDLQADQRDPVLSKQLQFFDRAAVFYFALNQQAYEPFKDKRVRQALALAFDRKEAARVALLDVNKPANGILPPGIPGYDPDFPGWPYDPERARKLLADAGYPNGQGLPKLTLTFREKTPDLRKVSEVAADMWKKNLNISVQLQEMEWGAFLEARNKGTMAFYHLRWSADYIDPQNFLSLMLHTDTPENTLGYSNPEFDRICDMADKERDHDKRMSMYRQAERIAIDDAPWITTYYQRDIELIKPYVQGIRDSLMGHLPHTTTEIVRDKK